MANDHRPTLISLFTGAGGLDIGLEMAGFRTVTAVDHDADCVATLRANQGAGRFFLGTRILHAAVETLQVRDLLSGGASRGWRPDLLAGGPPCQPFSSSGKMRSLDDPRGRLFERFVELADGLRPRLILFENVRGLVTARGPSGEPGGALSLVKNAFESIGYATTFALLNAADYGVPQRRVRCFMMAACSGPLPDFPTPTHAETPTADLFHPRSSWATLGDFLASRNEPGRVEIVRPSAELARRLADVPPGSGLKSPGARETTRPGGHWGYKQGTFVADPGKPARTVTAASTQDWIRLRDGSLRRLTWRECAGLQGFPDDWDFSGGAASRFRQIGNAVPVRFGEALGKQLLDALADGRGMKRRPESAPLPATFIEAIRYTNKEHARNGASRRAVLDSVQLGHDGNASLKGLGSAEGR